jgi:hypothetical protein
MKNRTRDVGFIAVDNGCLPASNAALAYACRIDRSETLQAEIMYVRSFLPLEVSEIGDVDDERLIRKKCWGRPRNARWTRRRLKPSVSSSRYLMTHIANRSRDGNAGVLYMSARLSSRLLPYLPHLARNKMAEVVCSSACSAIVRRHEVSPLSHCEALLLAETSISA